jgi:transmembrane sensor
MSRLDAPVKDLLRTVTTEASIARMWNRIEARGRVERRAPLQRPSAAHRFAWAAALLVIVGGVVGLALHARGTAPSRGAATLARAGAVVLADGSPLRLARAKERTRLALSDGSSLELDEEAAIEALENSDTAVHLRQSRGGVLYDIKPGGPRRWTIEYGSVTVEVIGTSFRIEHTGSVLRVEVLRGTVLVRADRVAGRAKLITAGMRLEVDDPAATPPAPPSSTEAPPPSASSPAGPGSAARTPEPSPAPALRVGAAGWRELARQGENERAYAELGSGGIARAALSASVDDLLALADVARLSAHPADAVAPLERVVSDHPSDSRASLAAFTLGRVRLDSLRAPAAAAQAFEKAIALGLPGGLAEDAYAHVAEARAEAGDEAGARAAFGEYARRFPNGARRGELRRLIRVTPGAAQ